MRPVFTRSALAAFALVLGQASFAETAFPPWQQEGVAKRPYIFTQQHNMEGRPDVAKQVQLIRLGYPLQVQLPGNPALWKFVPGSSQNVEYLGRTMVYSPDRIAGTQSILVFDLALSPGVEHGSEGYFTFVTGELPASLDNVVPGSFYLVRFQVIDPG